MNSTLLFLWTAAGLFGVGLYGLLAYPHPLRQALAANIMANGVFLVFIALARRDSTPDPVPQAMVLTGIVIAVSTTALALAIIKKLRRTWDAAAAESTPAPGAGVES